MTIFTASEAAALADSVIAQNVHVSDAHLDTIYANIKVAAQKGSKRITFNAAGLMPTCVAECKPSLEAQGYTVDDVNEVIRW